MKLNGKVVAVTGAGGGIGGALAKRFCDEGAKSVTLIDLDEQSAQQNADALSSPWFVCDVADEAALEEVIDRIEQDSGPIDLFCSNAGVGTAGGVDASNADWQRTWEINVMAQVYAARIMIPRMIARGGGYLLNTASAAGLLTNLGTAPYAVTKHGSVALSEWLAITHGDDGVVVSCLCPQGVNTAMLNDGVGELASDAVRAQGVIEPSEVADAVIDALDEERFLVLPHPEVARYEQNRAADHDRWISAMRGLQRQFGR
ncbi:MAG: SDR family oxidoreductase [Acidobacteria bacterium]|nr:SDR family oxidoreductase [Acidobacteriota bacterium]